MEKLFWWNQIIWKPFNTFSTLSEFETLKVFLEFRQNENKLTSFFYGFKIERSNQ